jgi:hypothetical protein
LAQDCLECHKKVTPNIVTDWTLSAHSSNEVDCATCHGDGHQTAEDVGNVSTVTIETCQTCHEDQVTQFKAGKHALAWAAMNAMPTAHQQPMALMEGMKGCGGCHKLGLKSEVEVASLKERGTNFGFASCDACHTRHTFSKAEAQDPRACATCHMGFDHPQYFMKQDGVLPESAAAPTCQICHMADGDHEVRAAWGFLALRTDGLAPYPGEEADWWADRATILQGLGVLDPEGNPTGRLDVVSQADMARLSAAAFDAERDKMIAVCSDCHSENFARAELAKGDNMIRETDALMAEAIREVAALYADGLVKKPESYAFAFPDLLTFHDAPTAIETRLFKMFLKHRMRAFQGAFHANPDYSLWYGWSAMREDLTDIKAMAAEMRGKE